MSHSRRSLRHLLLGVVILGLTQAHPQGQSTPHLLPDLDFPGIGVGPTGSLGIQDGVFTVNGHKKFLLFLSYFGGLKDAMFNPSVLITNFTKAKAAGFDGVRVFALWFPDLIPGCSPPDPYPLIKDGGGLNQDPQSGFAAIPAGVYQPSGGYENTVRGRFQFLLDQAWEKGLVVDVTFAPSAVGNRPPNPTGPTEDPLTVGEYGNGLYDLALWLKTLSYAGPVGAQTGYKHAFFDLGNEINVGDEPLNPNLWCKNKYTAAEILSVRDMVKAGDPTRLVTASNGHAITATEMWTTQLNLSAANLDFVAYHDPRGTPLHPKFGKVWWEASARNLLGDASYGPGWLEVTNYSKPIYYGEPERHRYWLIGSNPESESCLQTGALPPDGCKNNYEVLQFKEAAKLTKGAGGAAWLWHTEKLFRLASVNSVWSTVEKTVFKGLRFALCGVTWSRGPSGRCISPARGTFDGDRKSDLALWRPSTGVWYVMSSTSNFTSTFAPPNGATWGASSDVPVAGDYDGDSKTEMAVWRPSTGMWFVLSSSTSPAYNVYGSQPAPHGTIWGQTGDIPLAGDYDGDGKTDLAVWRPSTATWYVLGSSNGFNTSAPLTPPNGVIWGQTGDIPLAGDYDGDGKTDLTLWRPSTGYWYVLASTTGFNISVTQPAPNAVALGLAGDIPIAADFNDDLRTDLAVWRPGTGTWFVISSVNFTGSFSSLLWGQNGDIPLSADFDGDGKSDAAVWRPSTGLWYVIGSSTGYAQTIAPNATSWGVSGDVPLAKH